MSFDVGGGKSRFCLEYMIEYEESFVSVGLI